MPEGLKVGELYAELRVEKSKFGKDLNEAEKHSRGFGSRMGSTFKAVGVAAVAAFAVVGTAVVGFGIEAAKVAADREKALHQLQTVFGRSSATVVEWANGMAKNFGVADTAAMESVATLGHVFEQFGFTKQASVGMSEKLVQVAADFASFKNLPTADVMNAITKAALGQTRGLKQLGISITSTDIKNYGLAHGMITGKQKMTDAQMAAARYALILDKTALATGNFAKHHNDLSNQLKVAGALWENIMAKVGSAVLPLITAVLPAVTDAMDSVFQWVEQNATPIQNLFKGVMGIIQTAVKDAGIAFTWLAKNVFPIIVSAVQYFVEKVLPKLTSALDWITNNVVPAFGAVFNWLATNIFPTVGQAFDAFSKLFGDQGSMIAYIVGTVFVVAFGAWAISATAAAVATLAALLPIIAVIGVIALVVAALAMTWRVYGDQIMRGVGVVVKFIGDAWSNLAGLIGTIGDVMSAIWTRVVNAFAVVGAQIGTIINTIGDLFKGLATIVGQVWNGIISSIKGALNTAIGLINTVVDAVNSVQMHIDIRPPVGPEIKFDWNGIGLSKIAYLAAGTNFFAGGAAIVGERGPELVNLPRGTQVTPAGATAQMLGGGRGDMHITLNQDISGDSDDVEQDTRRALRRAALEFSLSGG